MHFSESNFKLGDSIFLKNRFGLRYTGIFVVKYVKNMPKNDVLVLTARNKEFGDV